MDYLHHLNRLKSIIINNNLIKIKSIVIYIYTRSTKEIRSRFNHYRCSHRNFLRNKKVNQESFHAQFAEGLLQEESDWEFRLIDQGVSVGRENLIGNTNWTYFCHMD